MKAAQSVPIAEGTPGPDEPVVARYPVRLVPEDLPDDARLVARIPAPQPFTKDVQLVLALLAGAALHGWGAHYAATHAHLGYAIGGTLIAASMLIAASLLVRGAWLVHVARVRERGAPVLLAPRLRLRTARGVVELTVTRLGGEEWDRVVDALAPPPVEDEDRVLDVRVDVAAPGGPREIVRRITLDEPPQAVYRGGILGFAVLAPGAPDQWELAYDVEWTRR